MATVGLIPATTISSGVISDPPPIPVSPIRIPTPSPKRMTTPSTASGHVQAAFGLVAVDPAALAALARRGARHAADRVVAVVVQRVVGQRSLRDAPPDVLVGPLGERVVLHEAAALVALDVLRVRPRLGLVVAPDPADPRLGALERAVERGDLRPAVGAAVRRAPWAERIVDLDLDAEVLLEAPPRLQRLGEEHAGVDRRHARRVADAGEHVDEDRRRLLERAQ